MILHTVTFKLKHDPDSDQEKDFLDAGKALSALPMVRDFKCYKQVSEKNDFDFGLAMAFESEADYQAYSEHPSHVEFVQNRWIPEVVDFLELDYVDYD